MLRHYETYSKPVRIWWHVVNKGFFTTFYSLLLCAYQITHMLPLSVDASLPLWPQHLKNKQSAVNCSWSQYFENMSPMLEESKCSGACCAKCGSTSKNKLKTWFWQKHPFQTVRIAVYNSLCNNLSIDFVGTHGVSFRKELPHHHLRTPVKPYPFVAQWLIVAHVCCCAVTGKGSQVCLST